MGEIRRRSTATLKSVRGRVWIVLASMVGWSSGCATPPVAALSPMRRVADHRLQATLDADARLAHRLSVDCAAEDTEACTALGMLYLEGRGVPPLIAHALSLFEYSCDLDEAPACSMLAALADEGVDGPPDLAKALAYGEKACKASDAAACTDVGLRYRQGVGVEARPRRAAKWFRRACKEGDAAGCHELGVAQLGGHGVAQDVESGLELIEGACDARHAAACTQLAAVYGSGLLVERDLSKVEGFRYAACAVGDGSVCTLLGWEARGEGEYASAVRSFGIGCGHGDAQSCALGGLAYEKGEGVVASRPRAFAMYREACLSGLGEACGRAMLTAAVPNLEPERLRQLYRLACDAGDRRGCHYLAGLLRDGIGGDAAGAQAEAMYVDTCGAAAAKSCQRYPFMGQTDEAEPLEWLDGVCGLDPSACTILGEVYQGEFWGDSRPAIAAKFYQRACAGESGEGCHHLAILYARGEGVEQDAIAAARLNTVACDAGVGGACAELSSAHEGGKGVVVDPALAEHYRGLACEHGIAGACGTGVVLTSPLQPDGKND